MMLKIRCKVVLHLVSFHFLINVSKPTLLCYIFFSGKLLVVIFIIFIVTACSFQTYSCIEAKKCVFHSDLIFDLFLLSLMSLISSLWK